MRSGLVRPRIRPGDPPDGTLIKGPISSTYCKPSDRPIGEVWVRDRSGIRANSSVKNKNISDYEMMKIIQMLKMPVNWRYMSYIYIYIYIYI